MKFLTITTTGALALILASCGKAAEYVASPADTEKTTGDTQQAGHEMGDGTGHGRGTIRSLGGQGDFLTIEHGPIEGIGMGAMTMGFDILDGVELSGFSEGDEVAFTVEQGRDETFRITAICDIAADGADCLDRLVGQ